MVSAVLRRNIPPIPTKGGKIAGRPLPRPPTTGTLQRTPATYPYVCAQCKSPGDHPFICHRCHSRNAQKTNPDYNKAAADMLAAAVATGGARAVNSNAPVKSMLEAIENAKEIPFESSGIDFVDMVMGGGIVRPKSVLIDGAPGAGKSTLLLQIVVAFAKQDRPCLYISGEEEIDNIALRAARIKGIRKKAPYINMVTTRETPVAAGAIRQMAPALVIVDSIQTIGDELLETHFGGQKQVDNLMTLCIEESQKVKAATIFVCQRTKAGDPAGPKRAEHLVDAHLKLEKIKEDEAAEILYGDEADDEDLPELPRAQYREFHSEKNRFAAAEIRCVLNMTKSGLVHVEL